MADQDWVPITTRLLRVELGALDGFAVGRGWSRSQLMRELVRVSLVRQGWQDPNTPMKTAVLQRAAQVDGVYTSGEVFDNLAAKAGDSIPIINDLGTTP